ncbi:prepilin-type N-terminal cleavage/methylation domain-containing protein [Acinetobacter indicus]|uniref:pilus assembly FimT family protein n=1 Tax=Acinetobacter indicus TaxID=756892 RepID=UPI001363225E|nr:prepilin-type N-terminal cleavage/methylation domain-containing protein [Acinetobacter indicus]MDM1310845.1 prepilin-type N-terminal cleavage/methylation domain-containing protein [Acinetobacter indicus]
MRKSQGFTLIELMVTIAVLAIVAMMAAPSFTDMLQKRKLESEVKDLIHILSQARSQAVLLKTNIVVGLNSSSSNTATNYFWKPQSEGILIKNIPDGHIAPPDIVFNAQGIYMPRHFVKMKRETNSEGDEIWVADQINIDGSMVDQLESYSRNIILCSKKLKVSKTINYSVIGTFDSIEEGVCS